MPASLELVRIALQAYANRDSEIALALAGPQVRWDERASRTDGDLVWGHEKVARAMRRYLDGWETYSFELEDVAEVAPGKVVGICRERGRPKEGSPVDRRFGALWIVEAGKLVSWTSYLTPREAVRAAKELAGPQAKRAEPSKAVAAPAPIESTEPEAPPKVEPEPEPELAPEQIEAPAEPAEVHASAPFDFEAAEPAAQPEPSAPPAPVAERPRKRPLTKSEEQKRAARARAKLRQQSSRQTA